MVAALERTWDEIQARHPDVPDVTLSLAFVKRTLGVSFGRHVIITFDALKLGPETVVATLLHEAAHQRLKVAGARDWHRHKGTFRRAARELGVIPDDHPFGGGELTPESRQQYSECIAHLAATLKETSGEVPI